jgi:hypothetical protein
MPGSPQSMVVCDIKTLNKIYNTMNESAISNKLRCFLEDQ